ncbi:signal peptidase I [Myxococcota bacterium]|jgi:signal peptidase I|nr:signal peptidase I [Myxococcota bacterium]
MGTLVVGPAAVHRLPWKPALQILGVAVLITLVLVRYLLVEVVRVRGNTMAPAITDGDMVLVRHTRAPGRGDVVLLELGGQVVLRRVLGIPGDHIATVAGALQLNELPIPTRIAGVFGYREATAKGHREHRQHLVFEELEPGRFVGTLGDHVGAGRPWRLRLPPATVEPGSLYVTCDNRRECPDDERQGLVPAEAVVGVAQSIFWYGDTRLVAPPEGESPPLTAGPVTAPPSAPVRP